MTLKEFLDKETPPEGGCMLVAIPRKDGRLEYLLIERFKTGTGVMFTINDHLYYDYNFMWDNNWEIIYKRMATK